MAETACPSRRIHKHIYDYCREHGTSCLAFRVLGRPQQVGSKTPYVPLKDDGRPHKTKMGRTLVCMTDSNKQAVPWMDSVRAAAAQHHQGPLLTGPLLLSALFYFRRPQSHFGTGRNAGKLKASAPRLHAQSPDLAKLVRAIEDAMSGIVYVDDRLICEYGTVSREWTIEQERAEIWIMELEGGDDVCSR